MYMKQTIISAIQTPAPAELAAERKWLEGEIQTIPDETYRTLIQKAMTARERTYNPYSHYAVGASILCESGNIYASPNIEVASYSETGHAEGTTIFKAVSEGEAKNGRKFIKAIVVCHISVGCCGRCRQQMIEHCDNAVVITINPNGNVVHVTSLKTLLPYSFSPTNLGK